MAKTNAQIQALLAGTASEVINALDTVNSSVDLQALEIAESSGAGRKTVIRAIRKALAKNPPEDPVAHQKATKAARVAGRDKRHQGEPKFRPWEAVEDLADRLILDAAQREDLETGLDRMDHVLAQFVGQVDKALTWPPTPAGAVAEALDGVVLGALSKVLAGIFRSFIQRRYDLLRAQGEV